MKPEALNGTVLGTCTLQQMIGRDGMGIVYRAQQANPPRPVSVKVLSLAQTASAEQRRLFLERFRREMKVVASLTHPAIAPVYEYGENANRDGIAYFARPSHPQGTLKDILAKEGQLPWPRVVAYLEQIAAALDYAHERGVLHQNIAPASMLLTDDGSLLLTDFGLVAILTEGLTPQERLLGTVGPVLAPDYIAPEQLTGETADGRADIYALGIVLYQMVTGKLPFQGETPIYIAAQQVQVPPPAPRSLRPDLPVAAEQVLLRALAKQAASRYARAQDFSAAFRSALTAQGIALPTVNTPLPAQPVATQPEATTPAGFSSRRSLFDPAWRASSSAQPARQSPVQDDRGTPAMGATPVASLPASPIGSISATGGQQNQPQNSPALEQTTSPLALNSAADSEVSSQPTGNIPLWSTRLRNNQKSSLMRSGGMGTIPATSVGGLLSSAQPAPGTGEQIGQPAGMNGAETLAAARPTMPEQISPLATPGATRVLPEIQQTMPGMPGTTGTLGTPRTFGMGNTAGTQPLAATPSHPLSPLPPMGVTGALQIAGGEAGNTGTTTTIKLTDAVKVVQVPVAGQPGRYMTGFLPVLGAAEPAEQPKPLKKRLQIPAIVALVALVLFGSIAALLIHAHSGTPKPVVRHIAPTPNITATAVAQVTATADANIILQDPLTENIHSWPNTKTGTKLYFFSSDGYHIADNDNQQSAPAILPGENITGPMAYTLTMKEIKGNDNSLSNTFGMILRFANYKKGNQMVTTFYVFEILNMKGGQYQFWRYDSSQANHWTSIWKHNFGGEFHMGHGSGSVNTVKIFANGKKFSFTVNGKGVGSAQDGAIASGEIGMLVNLKGTEVAFSNLSLTHS